MPFSVVCEEFRVIPNADYLTTPVTGFLTVTVFVFHNNFTHETTANRVRLYFKKNC